MFDRPPRVLACVLLGAAAACCSDRALSHRPFSSGASAAALEAPVAGLPDPMVRGDSFRRGVVLGPLVAPENSEAFKREHSQLLENAASLGATDVKLIVRWQQPDLKSVECAPYESLHDELLFWLIEQAKQRKLRVVLSPELAIADGNQRDIGKLKPSSWERWWWSYRRLALHYARVAGTRKVSLLTVGTMLTSTEGQAERWRALIQEVRKIYKGKLAYVASAESFDKVTFWDALDVMDVAVEQAEPRSERQLIARLEPLVEQLDRSTRGAQRGYVITGGRCGSGQAGAEEELLCQRALFQSFRDASRLEGVFVREAAAGREPSQADGQSAAAVVRHWYQKSRG